MPSTEQSNNIFAKNSEEQAASIVEQIENPIINKEILTPPLTSTLDHIEEAKLATEKGVGPKIAASEASEFAEWKADPDLLRVIIELGFTDVLAEKGLFYTGNKSVEAAITWIVDHPEFHSDTSPLNSTDKRLPSKASSERMCYQMIFVINAGLKMGLGKMAAQVGHATLNLYKNLERLHGGPVGALKDWTETGETKLILKCQDDKHLFRLLEISRGANLPAIVIRDAGHTQVAPNSATVLAVFGTNRQLEIVTNGLKMV